MSLKVFTISTSINVSAKHAYDFASNPEHLPQWASGLSESIINMDGTWIAQSPMGRIEVKFAERNDYGVLDHEVTLPSGVKVFNPMRVVTNGTGCEVIFTLFRQAGMSDEQFLADSNWVKRDLEKLKELLERP